MHLSWRTDHGVDDRNEGPDLGQCSQHVWRLRGVTFALPGAYVCEVCERCGAMHIDGPDELTDLLDGVHPGLHASTGRADDGDHLDSFARRWSPRDEPPPSPPSALG